MYNALAYGNPYATSEQGLSMQERLGESATPMSPPGGFPCIKMGATDGPSRGAVSAVQEVLRLSGLSPLTPGSGDSRGVFGAATDARVRQFQSNNGFTPDGIVGPVTGKKLGLEFQKCSAVMASGRSGPVDPDPVPLTFVEKVMVYRVTDPVLFHGVAALIAVGVGFATYKIATL